MSRENAGKEAADKVSRILNSSGFEMETEFVQTMANDHRSLQQAFTRLCVRWFRHLAECGETARFDLRNEASVKLAQELKPILDKHALPRI